MVVGLEGDDYVVMAPFPSTNRGYFFVAVDGRGPFSLPGRIDLSKKFGSREQIPFNAAATANGKLVNQAP